MRHTIFFLYDYKNHTWVVFNQLYMDGIRYIRKIERTEPMWWVINLLYEKLNRSHIYYEYAIADVKSDEIERLFCKALGGPTKGEVRCWNSFYITTDAYAYRQYRDILEQYLLS